MSRTIAAVQAILGLLGIGLCFALYLQYRVPLQNALRQLEHLAADTEAELQISRQLVTEVGAVVEDLELAAESHGQTLQAVQGLSSGVSRNLQQWREQLEGFSKLAIDAGRVCDNFGEQLPIKIPIARYDLDAIEFEIPSFEPRERTVKLPYPTVKLGSRSQKVDVGVTTLSLDMPTLEVGSANRTIRVPDSPKISVTKRAIQVPANFRVVEHEVFQAEKMLLRDLSKELKQSASSLDDSSTTIERLGQLIDEDFSRSLAITQENLQLTQSQLHRMRAEHIPATLERISNQTTEVAMAQDSFSRLQSLIPWGFLILGMIPTGVAVHGCFLLSLAWRRSS